MVYPCYFYNRETKKGFYTEGIEANRSGLRQIEIREKGIFVRASAGEAASSQWGKVQWEVLENNLLLHTIESHPEKGTGLGSLLMYLVAVEAKEKQCGLIHILSAAPDERDFYFHMGCDFDMASLYRIKDLFDQKQLKKKDIDKQVGKCPLSGTPAEIYDGSLRSTMKRWSINNAGAETGS